MIQGKIMKKILITLFSLIFAWAANASYAGKTISVTVVVEKNISSKMRIFGTGFSVNNKSSGSMGSSTTKTGPAGGKYSFGFRIAGKDVSCGTALLKQNSIVLLYFRGNKCVNKVMPK